MMVYPLSSTVAYFNMHHHALRYRNILYNPSFEEDFISDSECADGSKQNEEFCQVVQVYEEHKEDQEKERKHESDHCHNFLSDPSFEAFFLSESDCVSTKREKRILEDSQKDESNYKNYMNKIKSVHKNAQNIKNNRREPEHPVKSNGVKDHLISVNVARSVVTRPIKRTMVTDEKPILRPLLDWNDYHRLDTIHSFMDNLETEFPSICTTGTIGKSWEGRDLKILKISNSNASNASVWIDAGIHAREWIAPATNTFIADNIARNFNTLPEYVTNKDWYFLPVMNPDGYEYSHTSDRMWRKNRAWHRGQCVGVDLNRNFSYGFGCKGSSGNPTHSFYHGPEPFSEPESAAVKDMLVNSDIQFSVYLTLHSYGQVIVFPYAFQDKLCPGYLRLLEGATVMSRAIYNASGNTYRVGISGDVMYGAAGTSNDFSYGVAGIPYCYLLELRSKKHKFRLPKNEIQETGEEILSSVFSLMEFVDNYTPPRIGTEDSESSESASIQQSHEKLTLLLKENWYVSCKLF